MSLILANANIVVVARNFNPSVVNQIWLVDNNIVAREEFSQGCLFSDPLVNIETEKFSLLVTPEQLQFTPKAPADLQQDLIEQKMGKIIEMLPHTPYAAIGLNFTWHIHPNAISISQFSRRYCREDQLLSKEFDTEDARFGAYFSKDMFGGRLKLDVKPLTAISKADGESIELMQLAFNLHFDIQPSATAVQKILGHLKCWEAVRDYSCQLAAAEGKE